MASDVAGAAMTAAAEVEKRGKGSAGPEAQNSRRQHGTGRKACEAAGSVGAA